MASFARISEHNALSHLAALVHEGLIARRSGTGAPGSDRPTIFRFTHDRMQEAALSVRNAPLHAHAVFNA